MADSGIKRSVFIVKLDGKIDFSIVMNKQTVYFKTLEFHEIGMKYELLECNLFQKS